MQSARPPSLDKMPYPTSHGLLRSYLIRRAAGLAPCPARTCWYGFEGVGRLGFRPVRRRFAERGAVGGSVSGTIWASDPFA
jgi:hypothetical protein